MSAFGCIGWHHTHVATNTAAAAAAASKYSFAQFTSLIQLHCKWSQTTPDHLHPLTAPETTALCGRKQPTRFQKANGARTDQTCHQAVATHQIDIHNRRWHEMTRNWVKSIMSSGIRSSSASAQLHALIETERETDRQTDRDGETVQKTRE